MTRRIGYNIIGDAPNVDLERAYQHVAKVKPAWVIVINRLDLAKRIAANVPETNVIVRWVKNDDDPIAAWQSPERFIAWVRQEFGGARLYANISNEAGFSDNILQWTLNVIDGAPDLCFAVGGFSVGTPEPGDWERPKSLELLRRLATQHQRLVLNLHEYFPALPHAGMDGEPYGNPNGMPEDIRDIDCWLVGRYQFLVNACQAHELPIPRIVIGECGPDRIDQFKTWLGTLRQTAPYVEIRGWKTLKAQWQAWYNKDPERVLFDLLAYVERVVYYIPQVECMCLFAWCSPQSEWEQFDISQALLYQQLREADSNVVTPPVITVPVAGRYTYEGGNRIVRKVAGKSGANIGLLSNGNTVEILSTPSKTIDKLVWIEVVVRDALTGWIAYEKDEMLFTPQTSQEPAEPDYDALFADLLMLISHQRTTALTVTTNAINAQFDALEANVLKIKNLYSS